MEAGERPDLTTDEQQAEKGFKDTTVRLEDGKYQVTLPKKTPALPLGHSRTLALKRYNQNKKALVKKGQWQAFHKGLLEYSVMGHAERVGESDLANQQLCQFYLPTHGVVKSSSTTTKLRVVLDGSAVTSTGYSLNDVLLPAWPISLSLAHIRAKSVSCAHHRDVS